VQSVSEFESETALVIAAQADPGRFAALYSQHVGLIHSLAWNRLGDRATAEDVTAETFRRALRALPRYEPRGVPFRAWLCRICTNLVNDELNRRKRAARFDAPVSDELQPQEMPDHVAEAETRAMVHALIDRLPSAQRNVIVMRFAEDMSIADVAERLGRSPDAVKQLQRRALAGLRQLAEQGGVDA